MQEETSPCRPAHEEPQICFELDGQLSTSCGFSRHLLEKSFKFTGHLGFEIALDLVNLSELRKGPTTVGLEVVYAEYPVALRRGLLFFRIFAAITFDLDNEMQWRQCCKSAAVSGVTCH